MTTKNAQRSDSSKVQSLKKRYVHIGKQKFIIKTNYEHIEKLAIGTNKVLNSYKFVGPIILM